MSKHYKLLFGVFTLLFYNSIFAQNITVNGSVVSKSDNRTLAAENLYKQAVTASLSQYGVADNDITTYLAQPATKYDARNYKKSIGEQKWIALFGQGLEAFAEWRRLDFPKLAPAAAGVLNNQLPVRFIYPGTEQSLNKENYKKAVTNQGQDVLTTKLWFDMY